MSRAAKAELLQTARLLHEAAADEGLRRSAVAKAMAIVEGLARAGRERAFLHRAADAVRAAGFEGQIGAQAGRFLDLLAGADPRLASVLQPLTLEELLYVGHWARRWLGEEAGRPRPTPRGGAVLASAPARPDAPTAMGLALQAAFRGKGSPGRPGP